MSTRAGERTDPAAAFLADYRPLPGIADEFVGEGGTVRPAWRGLIDALARMPVTELAARHARGEQYLSDAGVYYRHYGSDDAAVRDWPLSHMPILIAEDEWARLAAGLVQRADLLELVLADVYGENALVAEGHLPAAVVADNPEWLRPLVGVRPRGGRFLHFVAFDLGRGPDGEWWVLCDRTQAPSGAGFALENRIATTRVYGDLLARLHVHRLAGFFRTFRDALIELRGAGGERVAILTPGPLNDTYFEHAYIARYLGFSLLEGEDLTVHDGRLLVRTVAGLKPISVLWRRLDAQWADPLELNEASRLGTPGMVGAVRSGSVTLVNALGSGVVEARAFLAFLPRIAKRLTGAPLTIPNIATWWCGQKAERDYVWAHADRMAVGSAWANSMSSDADEPVPPSLPVARRIDEGRGALVGQESFALSTTPAFHRGRLVPRPMSLRVFLARTQDGWTVMPGGFARIGRAGDTARLALQEGGTAADVWIVSRTEVPADTMLAPATATAAAVRETPGQLPSRAADSLFWLGRYVERAEHTVRLVRAYHIRLAEAPEAGAPLLEALARALAEIGADPREGLPAGAAQTLASAAHAAGHVRDRFSVDGWNALDDLSKTVRLLKRNARPGDDMVRASGVLLRKLSGFSGLVAENMYRFTGWRFLSIGRSLERAMSLSSLLATFADPAAPDGSLDLAIEVADSIMTHRRRYPVATSRATVVDLLALDPHNPRSVLYQLNAIDEHLHALPGGESFRAMTPLQRTVLKTRSDVALALPGTLDTAALETLSATIASISGDLAGAYFR